MSTVHPSFSVAIDRMSTALRDYSKEVHPEKWQGIDVSRRPEAAMREVIGWDAKIPMSSEDVQYYRDEIKPNLPFADVHFEERVCGFPMNPGEAWKIWPWAQSADTFRDSKGRFEINYMERYWASGEFEDTPLNGKRTQLSGIRGRPYGDLGNILGLLAREPLTRQAYLPIYFPEDTGAGGRVPCTLGYYFLHRGGYFHCHYMIRSMDFYRHTRDDLYLSVRLTLWLLAELRKLHPVWNKVRPGYFSFWVGNLHIFCNDYVKLFK